MADPKRIVFSRKGFDSSSGCIPSPILDDDTMLSLPIPDPTGPVRYRDLSLNGHAYGKLITDLGGKRNKKGGGLLSAGDLAHLDPDLIPGQRARSPGWRAAFGQRGAAAQHLSARGVGRGDLFVFFGWFRKCEERNGRYQQSKHSSDLHVVFGYLRIEEVILTCNNRAIPEWLRDHAQLQGQDRLQDPSNTVFIATEQLGLPGAECLPGAAAFGKFADRLQLTDPSPNRRRSVWRLPRSWYRDPVPCLSYHEDSRWWSTRGNDCLLQTVGRGQEFVLDTSNFPEAIKWVSEMIREGVSASPTVNAV